METGWPLFFVSADALAAAGATAAVEAADAPLSLAGDAGSGATNAVAARLLLDVRRRVVSGFQQATEAGPLREEPLHAVAAVVVSGTVEKVGGGVGGGGGGGNWDGPPRAPTVPSCPLMDGVREATRRANLDSNPCTAEAKLAVTVQVFADGLAGTCDGRRGRVILNALADDRLRVFPFDAEVPIRASFCFDDDFPKTASSAVRPQVLFRRLAVVTADRYWVPSTEEKRKELGLEDGAAAGLNLAR